MATPRRKKPKPPSERDRGYSKMLHHLVKGLSAANTKLDLLAENAGLGGQLEKLNQELKSSTDSLAATLKAAK